jgi:uncharacterized protein (DUF362 family)
MDSVDRRGFLRVVGEGALLVALGEAIARGAIVEVALAQDAPPAPGTVNIVGLNHDPGPDEIYAKMKEAVYASSDLSWLKPNQTVAIKIVSNSGKPYPFTTHPEALKALIRILKEKEPTTRVIVADQPGSEWVAPSFESDAIAEKVRAIWKGIHSGTASGMEVLRMNGLYQAATEAGAEVQTFDREEDWVRVGPTAHWPKGFRIPKLYGQVDHVVELARPAGHAMAGYTGTLKGWYGWLHPDDRIASHTELTLVPHETLFGTLPGVEVAHLHECIAEVAAAFAPKTRLALVAAIGTYSDIGPDWGKQPLEQSMILSSTDMTAADAVTAALVSYEDHRVPEEERKKNWSERPWYRRWWQPWEDEAFWGGLQGEMHAMHGSVAFDVLAATQLPGGVYALRQIERAREIGLGAAGGVSIQVASDAPIASDVAAALGSMTKNPPTAASELGARTGLDREVESAVDDGN